MNRNMTVDSYCLADGNKHVIKLDVAYHFKQYAIRLYLLVDIIILIRDKSVQQYLNGSRECTGAATNTGLICNALHFVFSVHIVSTLRLKRS